VNYLIIALYIVGGGLALLALIHLLMFMIWWMMLPFTMMLAFMETIINGKAPEHLVRPQCPFMKWWRGR